MKTTTRYLLTIEVEGRDYEATDTVDAIEEAIATIAGDELNPDTTKDQLLGRDFDNGETVWIRIHTNER